MSILTFKTPELFKRYQDGILDQPVKTILRDIAMEFGKITVTCLDRNPEQNAAVGGVNNSKHLINPVTGKCEAVDWVISRILVDNPNAIIEYVKKHFKGVDILYHDSGTGFHFHLEKDLKGFPAVQIF